VTIMHAARIVGILALMALAGAAWSQDAGPFAGKWIGTMTVQSGRKVQVDLELQDAGGTWHMSTPDRPGRSRGNPCLGLDMPLVVVAQSQDELQFDVQGGKVIKGCIDERATLTTNDGKSLQGQLSDGRALTFSRR
jgi:hypothetical protein